MTAHRHVVYRAYDRAGRLLYVGMTQHLHRRMLGHATSAWLPFMDRLDVQHFQGYVGAAYAEARAIRAEAPLFNLRGRTERPADIRAACREYVRQQSAAMDVAA